jgi:hypothetical protein
MAVVGREANGHELVSGDNLCKILPCYVKMAGCENRHNIGCICKSGAAVITDKASPALATVVNAVTVPITVVEAHGAIRSFLHQTRAKKDSEYKYQSK